MFICYVDVINQSSLLFQSSHFLRYLLQLRRSGGSGRVGGIHGNILLGFLGSEHI